MANKTQERLLNLFNQAAGGALASGSSAPGGSRASDASAPGGARASGESAPVPTAKEHTSTFADAASSFAPSSDSGAGQSYHGTSGAGSGATAPGGGGNPLESVADSVFGGALGLIPLAGALYGLFDSSSPQPQVFQKYEKPSSISFEAAESGGGLVNSGYDQMGLPRLYDSSDGSSSGGTDTSTSSPGQTSSTGGASAGATSSAPAPTSSAAAPSSGGASATPQISVNVQAMDAQSFMSYSGEIAKAVRDAMLNLSSINDVVSEL